MDQEKKSEEIKKTIEALVSFDITGSYYNRESKDELARYFKKILNHDDIAIRSFLKELFPKMKELAAERDLLPSENEENMTDSDKDEKEALEGNPEEEATETPEEEVEEHKEGGEEEGTEAAEGEEVPEDEELKGAKVKQEATITRGQLMIERSLDFLDS